ncbi:hypothetical protein [Microcoleus sp. PH2017_22_RUC_O_B]|uniref:hypothetical protein n=1 Tax=Microcoleus sp. PH2017_22_RUC_O_B TaxID=2798833 RepID=UPI0025F5DEB0|nr:hypothetical protein [Microcoleus sp. PH2017_22_RUC_O_B]
MAYLLLVFSESDTQAATKDVDDGEDIFNDFSLWAKVARFEKQYLSFCGRVRT